MIAVTVCYAIEGRWIAEGHGVRVVRTPVGERAPEPLESLVAAAGARNGGSLSAVVGAGFCGGLREDLRLGDLVLADSVRHRGDEILVSRELLDRARTALDAAGHPARTGPCACVGHVAGGDEKRSLGDGGALSLDMESGPLARWARSRHIPFLSVRVVLDPLDVDLPFSADGSLFGSVLRHPLWSIRLARTGAVAGRTLGRALNDLMPALKEGP
jgi:4-hydroxy-3-methylbut-2-enyl diphosphate reductase